MTAMRLTIFPRPAFSALAPAALTLAAFAFVALPQADPARAAEPAPAASSGAATSQATAGPAAGPALDAAQEEAVRALVRDTIMQNPEMLIEALKAYDAQQKDEAEARARDNLVSLREKLDNDPASPVLGNPEGDVVIVEFFDYRCPYCKKVASDLRQAVAADGNIRFVLKEFPILGPDSILAARAALAAEMQGRYEDFHFKLMEIAGDINDTTIFAVAEVLELDLERFRADMNSDAIEEAIRANYALAEGLDIGGTPAFVIGKQIYPGAISMDDLRQAVAAVRAGPG